MRRAMTVGVMALAGWAAGQAQGAEKTDHAVVAVANDAGVPAETLKLAQGQASRIFAASGITIDWWKIPVSALGRVVPATDRPSASPVAYVNLVLDANITALPNTPAALGFTVRDRVYIFPGRILHRARFISVLGSCSAVASGLAPNAAGCALMVRLNAEGRRIHCI
jgi:hypothetical protein